METVSTQRSQAGDSRGLDRSLLLFVLGAVTLIVAGLIAIPLAGSRALTLAPASTPEGIVQRFYQALQAEDYQAAYNLVSPDSRRKLPLAEFRQQVESQIEGTQVRIDETRISGATATVEVTLTSFSSGDLFGSGEYSYQRDITLQREGESWRIVDGPFYLPVE
jgi:hypothetical protein